MTTGKNLSPTSWRLRIDSESELAQAIEKMLKAAELRMDSLTELMEPAKCSMIISAIDGQRTHRLTQAQGVEAAAKLVAYYPVKAFNDPDSFMEGAAANFEGRDINIVRRVIDPKIGIPAKNKFAPTIAEIVEALDEAEKHRFRVRATAKWMLDEHERRRLEAEEKVRDAEFYSPEAVARRKAQVAELLKGNKP